jgi:integrase
MPGIRLTAASVGGLRPPCGKRAETYFDRTKGAPPGFALRVTERGSRSYYLIYRTADSDQKQFLWIGDASRMTLAEARERAQEADKLRSKGADPVEQRKKEQRAKQQRPSVTSLVSGFIEAGESRKSAKTQAEYARILRAEIAKVPLGGVVANEVTAPELDALCRKVAKRSATMGNNLYKLLRASFRWGFKKDLVDRDVSARLDRPAEDKRLTTEERTLNDDEVRQLWLGVENIGREMATFIRLPLLCGTRRGETALAEWKEFELRDEPTEQSLWRIPAEHRKGQRGRRRGLVIPLAPLAARLLKELRDETGKSARVFPNAGEQFIVNLFRTTDGIRKATGVRFSLHDLRATCATGVRRMSGLPHVPALVLGHQGVPGVPDVTSRYDRADTVPEVAAGLNAWGTHIEGLLEETTKADVIPIRSKRRRAQANAATAVK